MSALVKTLALVGFCAGSSLVTLHFATPAKAAPFTSTDTFYSVVATNARWNHEVMGTPTVFVDGVPAEPVDSAVWDGVGSTPIQDAVCTIKVNPVTNRGRIRASWTDDYGKWTYDQTIFSHPHHPAGTQIGPSVNGTKDIIKDAITTNVYLHGDTGSGAPILPTVFTHLATWGHADVTLNGNAFENPFDGPVPRWLGHTMMTIGVRDDDDGTVRTMDGTIYNMSEADNGQSFNFDMELHLVFHDGAAPNTSNIPPLFQFFYHLVFEDLEVQISHHE